MNHSFYPSVQCVESFLAWLLHCLRRLEDQLEVTESVKLCLTQLNIETSVELIQKQQSFVVEAQAWHADCLAHWERLGYINPTIPLRQWIDDNKRQWLENAPVAVAGEIRTLLSAWDRFCILLFRIDELNKINQHLVEQASQDTRRRLYALMQYSGVGNGSYTAEGGATQMNGLSGETMQGRLLGKG